MVQYSYKFLWFNEREVRSIKDQNNPLHDISYKETSDDIKNMLLDLYMGSRNNFEFKNYFPPIHVFMFIIPVCLISSFVISMFLGSVLGVLSTLLTFFAGLYIVFLKYKKNKLKPIISLIENNPEFDKKNWIKRVQVYKKGIILKGQDKQEFVPWEEMGDIYIRGQTLFVQAKNNNVTPKTPYLRQRFLVFTRLDPESLIKLEKSLKFLKVNEVFKKTWFTKASVTIPGIGFLVLCAVVFAGLIEHEIFPFAFATIVIAGIHGVGYGLRGFKRKQNMIISLLGIILNILLIIIAYTIPFWSTNIYFA